jgi:glucose/arabinose dehydrogenase
MLGDDEPPGELNRVSSMGEHFGFPFCHGAGIVEPQENIARLGACFEITTPMQLLGPHVAPLGMTFYTGEQFPDEYRNQVFIAEHGSWNRSEKIGYRVSLVTFENGQAVDYQPFADGWLKDDHVSGRPVDVVVAPDGSLLVSDDRAGKVYRIRYVGDAAAK